MEKQIKLLTDLDVAKQRFANLEHQMNMDLKELPEGHLMKRSDGRVFQVINQNEKRVQRRLREGDEHLIQQLKYKKYAQKALPLLQKWIVNIDRLLKDVSLYDPMQIEQELKACYRGLKGLPVFLEGDVDPEEWEQQVHPRMFEDGLIYPSQGGLMTRSKSEALIASKYESLGWKFQYEPVIELKSGRTARPDFAVMHPYKRKVIYHEHFGIMDDPEYATKSLNKLSDYAIAGVNLNDNLIITQETKQKPLTYQMVDEAVKKIEMM